MPDPFHPAGWQDLLATGLVCLTVLIALALGGRVALQLAGLLSETVKACSCDLADAITAVCTGKAK